MVLSTCVYTDDSNSAFVDLDDLAYAAGIRVYLLANALENTNAL